MATKTVTVKKGDTLSAIAKASGTTVSALAKASGIKDVNKISVGQKITVPTSVSTPTKSTSSSSSSKSTSSSSSKSGTPLPGLGGAGYVQPKTQQPSIINSINSLTGVNSSTNYGIKKTTPTNTPSTNIFSNFLKDVKGGAQIVGDALNNWQKNTSEMINKNKPKTGNLIATAFGSTPDASVEDIYNNNPIIQDVTKNLQNVASNQPVDNNVSSISTSTTTPTVKKQIYPTPTGEAPIVNNELIYPTIDGKEPASNSGSTVESSEEVIKETLDDGTVKTTTNTLAPTTTPVVSNYSDIMSKLNTLNTGLKDSLSKMGSWSSSGSKSEFQNTQLATYKTNVANLFSSPEEATKFYLTPEGKSSLPQGVTANDIVSNVQTVKNGLTEPKTTAEFLAYDKNLAKQETDLFNEQIANDYNWTQEQKDILLGKKDADGNNILLGEVEKQKKEQDAFIDYYEEKIQNEKTSAREKAQYMIDKAKAEFESKDAETEINRQNAKASLTEFLAKIGALRTDGNSLLGIEKLEQAYQAQRQALKNNFQLSEREIRMDMNDRINTLESDLDEKKFTLMQDLSKTEREVAKEVAKLDYDYKKDMASYRFKYYERIQDAKDKAATKAEKASSDWMTAYFTTTGGDMFASLPAEFRNTWLSNNQVNPQGFRTTQEDLAKDYASWSKNQNTGLKLTATQEFNLQKDGVDVEKYKTDEGYRNYVNSNLE